MGHPLSEFLLNSWPCRGTNLISSWQQLAPGWCTYWLDIIILQPHAFISQLVNVWCSYGRAMKAYIMIPVVISQDKQNVWGFRTDCCAQVKNWQYTNFNNHDSLTLKYVLLIKTILDLLFTGGNLQNKGFRMKDLLNFWLSWRGITWSACDHMIRLTRRAKKPYALTHDSFHVSSRQKLETPKTV